MWTEYEQQECKNKSQKRSKEFLPPPQKKPPNKPKKTQTQPTPTQTWHFILEQMFEKQKQKSKAIWLEASRSLLGEHSSLQSMENWIQFFCDLRNKRKPTNQPSKASGETLSMQYQNLLRRKPEELKVWGVFLFSASLQQPTSKPYFWLRTTLHSSTDLPLPACDKIWGLNYGLTLLRHGSWSCGELLAWCLSVSFPVHGWLIPSCSHSLTSAERFLWRILVCCSICFLFRGRQPL